MKKLFSLFFATGILAAASLQAQTPDMDLTAVATYVNGVGSNSVPLGEEMEVTVSIMNGSGVDYVKATHGVINISVALPTAFSAQSTTLSGPDAASFGNVVINNPQNMTIELLTDLDAAEGLTVTYSITGDVITGPVNMTNQVTGTVIGASSNSITSAISVDVATPVTLYDFNVKKAGESSALSWVTATESLNKGFVIERSEDSKSFTEIGFVSTKAENNTSNQKLSYNFQDQKPVNGENFYRLKQVDLDGKTTYSEVKSVVFESAADISIYPNPVNGQFNIKGVQATDKVVITNSLGQQVLQQAANGSSVQLNLSGYANGIYDVTILDANGNRVQSSRISKVN